MASDQERNKETVLRLYQEVFERGDIDAADKLITEDRPDHDPNLPPEMTVGRQGFKRFAAAFRAGFPDVRFVSELLVAEGDMVVSYNAISGTHNGEFMGMPATGRRIEITNADLCRFSADGLIAEHWGVLDMIGLLRQLGVVPPAPWQR
ncbi:MAG TPA: ester cyclase [Actinomycetes bacterium]|nr:ester cyclase [Actinomycetes bacterium]